jgi:hypothetical protein
MKILGELLERMEKTAFRTEPPSIFSSLQQSVTNKVQDAMNVAHILWCGPKFYWLDQNQTQGTDSGVCAPATAGVQEKFILSTRCASDKEKRERNTRGVFLVQQPATFKVDPLDFSPLWLPRCGFGGSGEKKQDHLPN